MYALKPDLTLWDGRLRDDVTLVVGDDGRLLPPDAPLPPGTPVRRLAGRALLPGLVNGHSHAFQRLLRGRTEYAATGPGQDDFWSWRELMYRAAERMDPEQVYLASRQAFVEMARAGITAVGEFHYLHHGPDGTPYADRLELARQVVRAAREAGLRICLLRVGYARAGHGVSPNPRQRRFLDAKVEDFLEDARRLSRELAGDPLASVGVAPHSVRAVPREWLAATAQALRGEGAFPAVHMHVAEQPKEIEACLAEHGVRPVELLAEAGLLSERFTAVHGIHLSEREVRLFGEARALVCACPSTERNLGDGVVPADALLAAGVRVSLGTDSQASIDLVDEARQLESHLRLVRGKRAVLDAGGGRVDGLALRLLGCATEAGAESLGLETGRLAAGRPADFFTVDLEHPALAGADAVSLLPALVFGAPQDAIREVAVAGRFIVEEGRHPLAAASSRAFASLSRSLLA